MVSRIGIHASVERVFPPSVLRDRLDDLDPDVVVVDGAGNLASCDALVTFAYDDSFRSAGLTWIHSVRAGVDNLPTEKLAARNVALTNSTGLHGDAIGETVAGYMLAFARRLHRYRTNQVREQWEWPEWDAPFTLTGETLCVVGLGTLGQGIATRADALGMCVTGVKRTPTPVDHVETVHHPSDLRAAVADARFVALAVPLTDETEGMIGEPELAAMGDDAVLVNVARGPVVDQSALVAALRSGNLGGAALDVFEEEPLPPDSPLWGMENVVVTPHAGAATRDYYRRIATLVRENARRLAAGGSLANRVV